MQNFPRRPNTARTVLSSEREIMKYMNSEEDLEKNRLIALLIYS